MKSGKNSTGEFARAHSEEGGREKARPVCSLSISSSSTSEPQLAALREAAASREAAISRGGALVARCAPWKFGGFTFIILKPRAEGLWDGNRRKFRSRGPINRLTCRAKNPNTKYTYCVSSRAMKRSARWHTAAKFPWHFTARRTKFHRGSRRSANG